MTRWKQKMAITDRGTFEYFVAGEGPPLCITHYYSSFTDKGNYYADMFCECFKVFLINLKDSGNSDKANKELDLSMLESVRDLEEIRKSLHLPSWSFAGHSTGGMLGLLYAAHYSENLESLIAVGAAASDDYMRHEDSIYCGTNKNNKRLKEIFTILRDSESKEAIANASREWTELSLHHPDRWDQYFSRPSSGRTVQSRLNYYNKHLKNYDIRSLLSHIHTPSLIMCGRYDAQCPVSCSEEIHRLVPESTLVIFEDSNHCPHLEEPELFLETVLSFFHQRGE